MTPTGVDLVVLSAAGLVDGDVEEAGAVLDVFGDGPAAAPSIAPKAILGETWGASGALAAALAIEAMRTSTVPAAPRGFVLSPELAGLNVPHETLRRADPERARYSTGRTRATSSASCCPPWSGMTTAT